MRRRGFTLVEVLVATVVASIVVSIAAQMFGTSTEVVTRASRLSEIWTREANGRRWLDHLLSGMEVENTAEGRFQGNARGMRFWTHYPVSSGWSEEGSLTLTFEDGRLLSRLPDGSELVLADSLSDAWFDYLLRFGASSPWITGLESGSALPIGVRLRLHRSDASVDTLVFFIGQRS